MFSAVFEAQSTVREMRRTKVSALSSRRIYNEEAQK